MNAKPVLLLSLLANLTLAGTLVWAIKSKPAAANNAVVTATKPTEGKSHPARAETKTETATGTTTVAANQKFDWRLVESEDYRKYIANLRSIGCPEETIRDIITADVNKLYESKRKELAGPKRKFEYWKPGAMMGAAFDPERAEKERALNKEKRALITELLGSPPDDKPDLLAGAAGQLEAMFDFLPAEKRGKVFEMMQDMQTKMQKIMKNGMPDAEDMRKMMKESEAALAGVLTPEELLDYNLRFSMTANVMRMQMASFEPSEQEFLELFKKRKAYDDEYGLAGMGAATLKGAEKEKQKNAEQELDDAIKQQFGEARYQEYKRSQDYAFQAIYRVTERENLGKDSAIKVYDMKKVAEDQAKALRTDKSLDSTARTVALQGIRTETEKAMRGVLGEKGFDSYQNQAYWLKTISPDPKSPTP